MITLDEFASKTGKAVEVLRKELPDGAVSKIGGVLYVHDEPASIYLRANPVIDQKPAAGFKPVTVKTRRNDDGRDS